MADPSPVAELRHELTSEQVENLRSLLVAADQDQSIALMRAFDAKGAELQPTVATVMWALAQLWARVLAQAPMGEPQQIVAANFSQLLAAALPAMMLMHERATRPPGGPAHDA